MYRSLSTLFDVTVLCIDEAKNFINISNGTLMWFEEKQIQYLPALFTISSKKRFVP